ncbi:MAG: S8 family serine peptidase, partial [Acidimicrobiia bacterium]
MWGLGLIALVVAAACAPIGPGGKPQPTDCVHWRYGAADTPPAGVLPPELDRDSYKVTSARDPRPELFGSPHNHCGQKGPALDLAFGVTKGRDDIVIAVLDSGIKWRDAGSMRDLATQAAINLGEARPGCASASGDCNGDGRFDIGDFAGLPDRNGNGLADPEDLILDPAANNGVDDDRNGYVDDISGWDFLVGDNNPLDTVGYGHGTGEAKDSVAAENGVDDVGTCPKCRFLPVRVGDSFIADGGRFAAGVLFALDSGADVVQEALGALSNPPQAQQAIEAAYERGVVVVASMADEAAKHPNLPSSLEHTMTVNSVTEQEPLTGGGVTGYLALNGCTNFGGRTFLAIPSGSCSSEATGRAAGMVGLVESVARDSGGDLTADEVMQVLRATADDIDFSTPNAVDPANDFGTPTGGLLDTVRYPTTKNRDASFGYGRVNVYEAVKAVRAGRIPPTVDIDGPQWFASLPATGRLAVTGRVAAPRSTTYDYRVEWAPGLQAP